LPLPQLATEHLDEVRLLERVDPALDLQQLGGRHDPAQHLEALRVPRLHRRGEIPGELLLGDRHGAQGRRTDRGCKARCRLRRSSPGGTLVRPRPGEVAVRSWARLALDCLFPRSCAPCGASLEAGAPSALCPACRAAIAAPSGPPCARCGATVTAPGLVCVACVRRPPAFASARALGPYRAGIAGANGLARTVQALKYH